MIGALGKILDEVQFGPYKRKVKKYLDEARADSVLEDLKKALAPRLRGVKSLWTTFDTYCVEDSSQQPYWNDNSFRKYLEKLYPDVAMSEASIQLLWRCFYFYAYHPFPRDTTDGKLDSAAFQRAVALLVVQGTDILGTQDGGDYFWRNDDAYFRKANFESIFRSIGLPENTDRPSNHLDYDSTSILEAAMDVLAMTQPHTVSLAPSPDQLRPAAQKLLGEGASQRRYRIGREDLSALLSLLLRLRLREAKWGSRFHFGTIGKRDPGNEELADILVRGLGENQDEEYLTSGQIIMSMDLLPNLQLQFHQLWAVLFQPPMTADDQAPSQIPGAIPNHILAAISLFIPQPKISSHSQPTTQDMRISLEDSFPPSQRSYDPTVTRLVQSLVQDPHPHLILLTSNATATTPLTVIGAYFPRPLSNAKGEKREPKTSTPHLLFQLRPNFRLLRWNGPHMLLTQIINTEDDAPLLRAVAASDEPPLESTKAYRIGDPERKGAGLCIDPETKSATLTSNITDTDSGKVVGYKPVYMTGNDNDITAYSNWEVAVKIDHFEIFRLKVGIDAHVASEGAKDQNQYAQDATQEKIQGEELSKRIQGFGSTSC